MRRKTLMRAVKKISKIMLIVGEVLSFVYLASFIITSIVFFILGSPLCTDLIVKGVEEGQIHTSYFEGSPEEIAMYVQIAMVTCGVIFVVVAALSLVNGILADKARKKPSQGLYIANIVLGLLSCVEFNLIGGILGLIAGDKVQE